MDALERKILFVVGGILAILAVGTAGYIVIEGWPLHDAFFMTIITVSTVGYQMVRPLSTEGQMFTSFLILVGFGAFAYLATQVAQFVIHGELTRVFGERKMKQRIHEMKNHYIVCGYGRVGQTVCAELRRGGVQVVVIEQEPDLVERARGDGLCVLGGDSMSDAILQEAGIDRAAGVVSAVSKDADNLLVTLSARELNHNLYIISRGENPDIEHKLLRAGADTVISPFRLTGEQIAGLVLSGSNGASEESGGQGASVGGYRLETYAPRGGRVETVEEIVRARGAAAAVGLEKGDGEHVPAPPGATVVGLQDRLILARRLDGEEAAEPETPPETVLIADDHQALLKIFCKKLRAEGYEVLPASTGTEALELIRKMHPSLAVLDAMMPGITGYDICKQVRAEEEVKDTPLILFSASNVNELKRRGAECGADRIMTKTGKSSELLEAVEALLQERREAAKPAAEE